MKKWLKDNWSEIFLILGLTLAMYFLLRGLGQI